MYKGIIKVVTSETLINPVRRISTSSSLNKGQNRSLRSLDFDRRGHSRFQEMRKNSTDPLLAFKDYGVREPGFKHEDGTFEMIPEMIPELVVPDLTGFMLKPYVSFRAPDVKREEFTARELFEAVYQRKIIDDFNKKDLLEDGTPKNPSPQESATPEQALLYARKTGSDLFAEDPKDPILPEIYYRSKM